MAAHRIHRIHSVGGHFASTTVQGSSIPSPPADLQPPPEAGKAVAKLEKGQNGTGNGQGGWKTGWRRRRTGAMGGG